MRTRSYSKQLKNEGTGAGRQKRPACFVDKDMEEIISAVRDAVIEQNMIFAGEKVLCALSGGADSCALLLALSRLREELSFGLEAVHVEHGIRGSESLADMAFCEELCRRMDVPFHVSHVDAPRYASEQKLTLEEAARILRYRAFEEFARETGSRVIALAHHADDQAETVLMNLARGSGLRGLAGIRCVRELVLSLSADGTGDGKIETVRLIRPLLKCPRAAIEQFLEDCHQEWRTDSTNLSPDHTRNRIRRQILPLLSSLVNEQAAAHIGEAAQRLQEADDFLRREAARRTRKMSRREGNVILIRADLLLQEEKLMQEYILRDALESCAKLKDVSAVHIAQLRHLASLPGGKELHLPGGLKAVRKKDEICLVPETDAGRRIEERADAVPVSGEGVFRLGEWVFRIRIFKNAGKTERFPRKTYTKWLNYDIIKDSLCLRTRQSGDYLLIGKDRRKKLLRRYMIDEKIPEDSRGVLPLLASGSMIAWVVGGRISEHAKVTEETENILEITAEKANEEDRND